MLNASGLVGFVKHSLKYRQINPATDIWDIIRTDAASQQRRAGHKKVFCKCTTRSSIQLPVRVTYYNLPVRLLTLLLILLPLLLLLYYYYYYYYCYYYYFHY